MWKAKQEFGSHPIPRQIVEVCASFEEPLAQAICQTEKAQRGRDVEIIREKAWVAVTAAVRENADEDVSVSMASKTCRKRSTEIMLPVKGNG
jgi:hypothetical protein